MRFFPYTSRRPPLPRDIIAAAAQLRQGRAKLAARRSAVRHCLRPRILGTLTFPRMPRMM